MKTGNSETIKAGFSVGLTNIVDYTACRNTNYAINTLIQSDEKGLAKYGMLLDDNDFDSFVDHAIAECGDMLKYLTRMKFHLKELCNKFPNDEALGEEIRRIYGK